VFEIQDREVLVVFADLPPQAGETNEQHIRHENANVEQVVCRQEKKDAAAVAASQPVENVVSGADDQLAGNVGGQALALQPLISGRTTNLDDIFYALETF
jgi:hypothetical protein